MPRRYLTLDAMRGIAAVMVVALHYAHVFGHASLAVDFFFVLSGFVIAHAYEEKLRTRMTFGAFMRRRVERLWPLYLGALAIAFAHLIWRAATNDPYVALGSVTLQVLAQSVLVPIPGPPGAPLYPANVPAWSLAFELVANMAYALAARHLTTPRLVAWVGVAGGLLILTALSQGHLYGGATSGDWWVGLARVSFSFPLGVLLYRLRGNAVVTSNAASLALLAALAMLLGLGDSDAASDLLIVMIGAPALVLLGARVEPKGLLTSPFVWMGAVSYAVYVLHVPLQKWLNAAARHSLGDPDRPMTALVLIVAVLLISTIADAADVRLRRWLSNRRRGQVRPASNPVGG